MCRWRRQTGCFNSRLREEATCTRAGVFRQGRRFNSRLREEATGAPVRTRRGSSRFNSRLREEATGHSRTFYRKRKARFIREWHFPVADVRLRHKPTHDCIRHTRGT